MLKPIGVFSVPAVSRPAGRLYIGDIPWFRAEDPEKGSRMECPSADLCIIGLLDYASLV
jgi:hypothetical protein